MWLKSHAIAFAVWGLLHRIYIILEARIHAYSKRSVFLSGWALWGVLMVVLGIKHPPVIYWEVPLDSRRRMLGLLAFIILLITFIPSPFKIL